MINLTPLSEDFPMWVSEVEYEDLRKLNKNGWSNCETQKEWLVKLDYLRSGLKKGKISKQEFVQKERDLVLRWWNKWT